MPWDNHPTAFFIYQPTHPMKNIAELRKEYTLRSLDETEVADNPIEQFSQWLQEAIDTELPEPTAMTLSTATPSGRPSGRIVLLKGLQEGNFIFFTNYESQKGKELADNPQACLTFHWVQLERQVRIFGSVDKISEEESIKYYSSRPYGSQIGAHVSPQSQVIPSRKWLEKRLQEFQNQFENTPLVKPDFWGGYAIVPIEIEFWQGRPSRLHDRIRYTKTPHNQNTWAKERLAP